MYSWINDRKKRKLPWIHFYFFLIIRNCLILSGVSGGWTPYFTPDIEDKFQKWMETWKEVAKDVPFKYKINKV